MASKHRRQSQENFEVETPPQVDLGVGTPREIINIFKYWIKFKES